MESGLGFESRVRELLRLFDGQEVVISNAAIELPSVVSVEPWIFDEIEVDAFAKGSSNWLVECKYRQRQTTVKDLQKLHDKKKIVEKKEGIQIDELWVISKEGFKLNAVNFAHENGILISDIDELNRIAKQLKFRRFG